MDLLLKATSTRKREERDWNCEFTFSKAKSGVLPMGITRSLENIRRDLARLGSQGNVEGFFNNVANADKLSGAVEDIRDAMMEYQVCIHGLSTIDISNVCARLHCSKTSITRTVNSS